MIQIFKREPNPTINKIKNFNICFEEITNLMNEGLLTGELIYVN